jgi:hypothetical protein
MASQYNRLMATLGGGRSPRFRPIVWFEDDNIPVSGGQLLGPQQFTPNKKITFTGALWGIQIEVRFHVRVAIGGSIASPALTLHSEFPLGFIDRIKLHGANSKFQVSDDLHNINGNSLFRIMNMWKAAVPTTCKVSRNGGAFAQVIDQGGVATTAPTNTATTNTDYDVICVYTLPVVPTGIKEWLQFCYNPSDWSDLAIYAYIADQTGLFDNAIQANVTTTFGAIQGNSDVGGAAAAAGSPLIRFSLIELSVADNANAKAAHQRGGIGTKLLYRTFQNITTPLESVNQNALLARLSTADLPYIRYVLKTGNQPVAVPSNGVASVIDNLNNSEILVANPRRKQSSVRTYMDMDSVRDFFQTAHGGPIPTGYLMEDFCVSGSLRDAFDVSGLTSDDLVIQASVAQGTGALATQIGELVEERVKTY